MYIDISDIDLYELILEMWKNAGPTYFIAKELLIPLTPPNKWEIKQALNYCKYIEYIGGRPIKTDFGDLSRINTRRYNGETRKGQLEMIVQKMKNIY